MYIYIHVRHLPGSTFALFPAPDYGRRARRPLSHSFIPAPMDAGEKSRGRRKKKRLFVGPHPARCVLGRGRKRIEGWASTPRFLFRGRSETESMQYASRSNVYMSVCDELSACARTILCPSQFRPMPRAAGIKVAQPSPHGVLLPADLTKENNHLTPVLSYE